MENQAGWLLELLDVRDLRQVTLSAHDVGTAAAQILTVRAPDRVRELVLMDGVYETEWAMGAVDSIRSWNPDDAARLEPVLARRLRSIRALLGAYAGDEGGKRLIHAARCLDPRQTEGMTERLRATGVPVRVLWGADACGDDRRRRRSPERMGWASRIIRALSAIRRGKRAVRTISESTMSGATTSCGRLHGCTSLPATKAGCPPRRSSCSSASSRSAPSGSGACVGSSTPASSEAEASSSLSSCSSSSSAFSAAAGRRA